MKVETGFIPTHYLGKHIGHVLTFCSRVVFCVWVICAELFVFLSRHLVVNAVAVRRRARSLATWGRGIPSM